MDGVQPWPAPSGPPSGWPAPPLPPGPPVAPVGEGEREWVVDALRAVALLGIVVVNVAAYRRGVGPSLAAADGPVGGESSPFTIGLAALTEGRFYPLFSFLFGWGFAVQSRRARDRGRSVVGPWLRRCLALLVLGVLLFDGDILVTYAVIGAFLLVLQTVPARWLAALGTALVVAQALFTTALVALGAALTGGPDGDPLATVRAEARQRLADDAAVYAHGSFLDVARLRVERLVLEVPLGLLTVGGTVAGMMVLGLAAARAGWVDVDRWPAWLRAAVVPAWVVGLALSVPAAALDADLVLGTDDPRTAATGWLGYSLLGPLVALLWAGAILRLARAPVVGWALRAVAPAGRMSLTLYLSQSLVASFVFNGYGLGWGTEVGIGVAVAMAVGFWALQVGLAILWFRAFTMGPLEAVVRAFAYLRWPGMRRRR